MGYRSDVRIRLTKEDFTKLKEEFNKKLIETKILGYNLFDDMNKYVESENVPYYDDNDAVCLKPTVYFGWNCVKWYDGYEDVDFIMEFIQQDGRPYAFVRVGESSEGDIDFHSYGFDDIWTSVIFDDPSEEENSLTQKKEVKFDYDTDENGETTEFVVIDNKKYIDMQYCKNRIDELEGQFGYECECNKQFVELQNKFEKAKEIIEWLESHNKNYTKEQYNKILDLKELVDNE